MLVLKKHRSRVALDVQSNSAMILQPENVEHVPESLPCYHRPVAKITEMQLGRIAKVSYKHKLTFTLSVKENTKGVCFKKFLILKADWLKAGEELSSKTQNAQSKNAQA